MSNKRHIAFITGTRADFGKLKPLILTSVQHGCKVSVIATGMHMQKRFGSTVTEVKLLPPEIEIVSFVNQTDSDTMDRVVANTISGLSDFLDQHKPDALVVHGDRPEALAGAITGALRNTPVIHIEGGELSGTIDGVIRHAVSKLSHIHLVANKDARTRLIQLGEQPESIHVIGSPDIDIMLSPDLPDIETAKQRYGIYFNDYLIAIFHPVTTEQTESKVAAEQFVGALLASQRNFIVIHPNNDTGYQDILDQYSRFDQDSSRFRCFESLRFEYFLTLLRNASAIVGNSSAGIREAPFYGIPTVDIGSRQRGRHEEKSIISVPAESSAILDAIAEAVAMPHASPQSSFGDGQSAKRFGELIDTDVLFSTPIDKTFVDLKDLM
ncbi:MAG: UDP-N-acetylglucosamine 2-epimerase [Ilumatobacteraceae bacterium]